MLDGVQFRCLDDVSKRSLIERFSLEEVTEIVYSFDGNKCPGPDGFNFKFIQSFWDLLKEEVWDMVNEFYNYSLLPPRFSSFFVALIPKVADPHCLSEIRPISLLGCMYKIISKLLAYRLKRVLQPLISSNQSASWTTLCSLMKSLIMPKKKKTKRKCLILKVDFEKKIDTVNWRFLAYMIGRMGVENTTMIFVINV